jgi:hypothetical protein
VFVEKARQCLLESLSVAIKSICHSGTDLWVRDCIEYQ